MTRVSQQVSNLVQRFERAAQSVSRGLSLVFQGTVDPFSRPAQQSLFGRVEKPVNAEGYNAMSVEDKTLHVQEIFRRGFNKEPIARLSYLYLELAYLGYDDHATDALIGKFDTKDFDLLKPQHELKGEINRREPGRNSVNPLQRPKMRAIAEINLG